MNRSFTNRRLAQSRTLNSKFRLGFTLVELLIVITVIGILVGLLLPAIRGALSSSRELAIRTEMVQLEQAVESFKTEFGFYPPSFEQFNRTGAASLTAPDLGSQGLRNFLRFLNRVAPNHQESTTFFPAFAGQPRIVVWWNKIGRHLDQQSSIVFWLSGMCKSKQFPVTGGSPNLIEPFNAPRTIILPDGTVIDIERDVIFNFQPAQLVFGVTANANLLTVPPMDAAATAIVRDPTTMVVNFLENDLVGGNTPIVAAYTQPYGPSDGDLIYRYRDASSYGVVPYAYLTRIPGGARDDPALGRALGAPFVADDFVNPKTFQLISFGLDGESGAPVVQPSSENDLRENAFALSTAPEFIKRGYDNMTNFAAGRLELFVIENE